jgi:hypothetical protein
MGGHWTVSRCLGMTPQLRNCRAAGESGKPSKRARSRLAPNNRPASADGRLCHDSYGHYRHHRQPAAGPARNRGRATAVIIVDRRAPAVTSSNSDSPLKKRAQGAHFRRQLFPTDGGRHRRTQPCPCGIGGNCRGSAGSAKVINVDFYGPSAMTSLGGVEGRPALCHRLRVSRANSLMVSHLSVGGIGATPCTPLLPEVLMKLVSCAFAR